MKRAGTLVLLVAFVIAGASVIARAGQSGGQSAPRTSRDKVYAKEQAARGEKQFAKLCASCHDPATPPPPGKKKEAPLVGEAFVAEWQGRTLGELLSVILLTMPNDGSAVLSESDTEDVVAYLLQANGYPDGAAMKYDAAQDIVIVK